MIKLPLSRTLANHFILCALAIGAATLCCSVHAQTYPSKPIKFLVPYAAGGPVDVVARGYADKLSRVWNQPVLVENKVGANEVVAADFVSKSAPDGYTIMVGADPTFSTNQFLFRKLPYNPQTDLVPVTRFAFINMALIVNGSLPVNNMKEFVALMKANPGKYNFSGGAGTAAHVHFDAFLRQQGLDMVHVAYRGSAPAMPDLLAGNVHATFGGITAAKPYLPSGRLKLLAINGAKRTKSLPDVPTFSEAGFPNTEAYFFMGLAVPKGTPKEVLDALVSANRKVQADPAFVDNTLGAFGYDSLADTPEQFAAFLVGDRARWEKKIRDAGVKLEN